MFVGSIMLAVLALGEPTAQSQAPQETLVVLEIDTSALDDPDESAKIEDALRRRQVEVLADGGVTVAAQGPATIRIAISRWGEADVNYRFTVTLLEAGRNAPTVERTADCEACLNSELYDKVTREVTRVSGRLVYAPPEPEPEPEPEPGPGTGPEEGSAEPPSEALPPARRIGAAGWAGIAGSVAGLGMAATGVALTQLPPERDLGGNGNRTVRVVEREPGPGVWIGVGAGLLAAGVTLIVVDQTVLLDRRQAKAQQRKSTFIPSLSPTSFGLSWSGRF